MNLSYISGSDWQEFFNKYPMAAAFLNHASLVGEYKALIQERDGMSRTLRDNWRMSVARLEWIEKRLKDIELNSQGVIDG